MRIALGFDWGLNCDYRNAFDWNGPFGFLSMTNRGICVILFLLYIYASHILLRIGLAKMGGSTASSFV
jgi:hypothetical protein